MQSIVTLAIKSKRRRLSGNRRIVDSNQQLRR